METVAALSLKRRFEEVDSGSPCSTPKDSDDDISSNDSVDSCDSLNAPSSSLTPTSILRRQKGSLGRKQVRFDAVTVYYFSRRQGFTSVPSQGGSSLGMARHHCAIRQYTLGEFAQEQESSHRHILRQHLRQEKLNARKMKCAQADLLTLDDVSDEDLDVEGVEVDDCFFLQPLPTKRRRALLRASGIARIDAREKMELRAIRLSREECGCDCRFYCDPHQCVCSRAGIKCQVDRMSFPCGCSRDGCHNTAGRIEFNPLRVRTHYLHTIMKLDREKGHLSGSGLEEDHEEEPKLNHSSPCSPTALHSTAESQVETQCEQELMEEQCHSLEHENETAVLHLQSAEEQERRRECGEEVRTEEVQTPTPALCVLHEELHSQPEEVEGVFLQEAFPEGATLLCVKDNQEEAPALNEQASILFYQIDHVDTESLKAVTMRDGPPREGGEEPAEGANEPAEGEAEPVKDETLSRGEKEESKHCLSQTCKQDQIESPDSDQRPLSCMVNNDRVDEDHNFSAIECEGSCPRVEAGAIRLPPEV